jgi:hypothetical protein
LSREPSPFAVGGASIKWTILLSSFPAYHLDKSH